MTVEIDVWPNPDYGTTVTLASGAVITAAGASVLATSEIRRLLHQHILLHDDPTDENPNPSPLPPDEDGGSDATVYVVPAVASYGVLGDGSSDDREALHALCSATISASGGTITLQGPYTYRVGSSLTIPANVTLRVLHGAVMSLDAGVTLTVNGPIEAPLKRIFTLASGAHVLMPQKTVYPEWWGAKNDNGVTDNKTAIYEACYSLLGSRGTVEFKGVGDYYGVATGINLTPADSAVGSVLGSITIRGQGWNTQIKHTQEYAFGADYGGDLAIFRFQGNVSRYVSNLHVRDIRISGYSNADHIQCVRLGFVDKAVFDRVYIDSTANEGITSVSTDACSEFIIDGCYAYEVGCNSQHVAAYNTNANWTKVTNCTAIGCGQGVEHTGRGAIFSNNTFEKCLANGFLIASSTYHNEEIVVSGNRLFKCPNAITTASQTDSLGKMVISNNVITFCNTGVSVISGNNNGALIEGNYIYGSGSVSASALVLGAGRHTVRGNEFVYTSGTHSLSITSGTTLATGARGSGITEGMYVTIAGVTGQKRVASMVWSIVSGIFCTLDSAADATVSSASTTYTSGKWAYLINATTDDYHLIEGNTFRGEGWTTVAILLQGIKATIKRNSWENGGSAWTGFYLGLTGSLTSLRGSHTSFPGSLIYSGTERSELMYAGDAPALTWKTGDIMWEPAPTAGGTMGRVCVTAGTSSTTAVAVTGSITSGTKALTLSTASTMYVGAYITIAGVTGTKRIDALSGVNATIDTNADATVAGAVVQYANPTWKTFGAVTA